MTLMRPLPDQEVAIEKLRKVEARLCGDSMGVGKTVTGIGLDFAMREDHPELKDEPTLIIAEKIGLDVWDYHLQAMGVPAGRILVVNPAKRDEFVAALKELQSFQSPRGKVRARPPYRYYVCHWDVLSRVEELHEKTPSGKPKIHWAHVIADEVHLAKNRKAQRTIALKRISTVYRTGLSGTPADDKPQDLWSVLHWLYPRQFRSYWRFFERYVEYETHPGRGYRIPTGVKNIPELHRIIRPFYIRRTLLDVAPNMPRKVHVEPPITVKLGRAQRREYESMRDKAIALIGSSQSRESGSGFQLLAPAVIAVLTRLQQMALATLTPEWDVVEDEEGYMTGAEDDVDWDFPKITLGKPSPKLDAVMNLIETHEEEPFVVFTQFRGMADLVEEECQAKKISVVKITGEVLSKDLRTKLVQEFQDGKARVFVGTIAAAGKTITLTRAAHAIFLDRSWNPSKNEQAEDRLWRRTQTRPVMIYRIEAEDTIDQIRYAKIEQKGEWIKQLLNPRGM